MLALKHGLPCSDDVEPLCCKLDNDIKEYFFSDDPKEIEIAQSICHLCPAKDKCKDWATSIEKDERYKWGIYGGLSAVERHPLT